MIVFLVKRVLAASTPIVWTSSPNFITGKWVMTQDNSHICQPM